MKRFLHLIGCLFGRHWYKPSEVTVLGEMDWRREVYVCTAYHRCVYCGKMRKAKFEITGETL